jgi:hypothetical protein
MRFFSERSKIYILSRFNIFFPDEPVFDFGKNSAIIG